jgi:hypothetical protein
MLVVVPIVARVVAAPNSRIDLDDCRPASWNIPTVNRPETYPATGLLPDVAQPRETGVGGLGHRALDIEVEHGFG